MEFFHKSYSILENAIKENECHILISGSTGVSKTYSIRQLASNNGYKLITFGQYFNSFLGKFLTDGTFVESDICNSILKNEKVIFLLDEVNTIKEIFFSELFSLLDGNEIILPNKKVVRLGNNIKIFATTNLTIKEINNAIEMCDIYGSLYSRFSKVKFDYDEKLALKLLNGDMELFIFINYVLNKNSLNLRKFSEIRKYILKNPNYHNNKSELVHKFFKPNDLDTLIFRETYYKEIPKKNFTFNSTKIAVLGYARNPNIESITKLKDILAIKFENVFEYALSYLLNVDEFTCYYSLLNLDSLINEFNKKYNTDFMKDKKNNTYNFLEFIKSTNSKKDDLMKNLKELLKKNNALRNGFIENLKKNNIAGIALNDYLIHFFESFYPAFMSAYRLIRVNDFRGTNDISNNTTVTPNVDYVSKEHKLHEFIKNIQ